MAAVRGVMFASYPANAPVGPSDPSQYPKQGPHQFKPVRARRPCVHPLSPAPSVHAMHRHLPPLCLRTAPVASASMRRALESHPSLPLTTFACLHRFNDPCVSLTRPSPELSHGLIPALNLAWPAPAQAIAPAALYTQSIALSSAASATGGK